MNTSRTISDHDIYYSDEEDDEAQMMKPTYLQKLGELLPDIDPGQYDSDYDD